MWCHCLLASMGIVFLHRERHHFSLTVFRIFPLSLVYQHFIITTLGLYCLELAQTLESIGLYLLISLGSFQPVFLREFFRPPPFPFSSSVVFLSVPQVPVALLTYCSIFSFLFKLGNFYCSMFQFILSPLFCCEPSTEFLFQLLFFSVLKFSFSSLYFLYLYGGFLFLGWNSAFYFSFLSFYCFGEEISSGLL